jgi:hypothetical protein
MPYFRSASTASRPAPRPTQSPIQWVPGPISLRVKRPGREADHSPPSSTKAKNDGAVPLLHHKFPWRGAQLI